MDENDTKWVQNGRQVLRIGPPASPDHFLAFGTGPAAQNRQNRTQTPNQPPPAAATLQRMLYNRARDSLALPKEQLALVNAALAKGEDSSATVIANSRFSSEE